METDNFFNLNSDFFSLVGCECKFNICKTTDLNGKTRNTLTVCPVKDSSLHYAFSGTDGLCRTTPFGSIQSKNILASIISLPDNKAKNTLQFFEENGFLFPLKDTSDTEIDLKDMLEIINRIKATVLLMTALENPTHDYDHILHLSLYLLLGSQVTISLSDKMSYSTYRNPIFSQLSNQILSSTLQNNFSNANADETEYFTVKDMIYPPTFRLKADEYEDIESGETFMYNYPGISDVLYRQLTITYRSTINTNQQNRLLIEFLFHYMNSVGVIKSVSYEKGIEYYGKINADKFDNNLKNALLAIGRIVLAGEINYNVSKMRPQYNPRTMESSWKSPSLLTALYFSIFYMKPGSEIYRKCANPACHKYFLVKTSNSRKKYCCDNCRNATNQRSHRIKVQKET